MMSMLNFDNEFRVRKDIMVAGIDEAGRGSLAGPVAAACVILPSAFSHKIIKDSKLLSAINREKASRIIKENAIAYAISYASHLEVDRVNVLQATYLAMMRAFRCLSQPPDVLLIDGPRAPKIMKNQHCIINGDNKSLVIAAASILAKVFRDRFMIKYHKLFPQFMFNENKGYPTSRHKQAIQANGPCTIHRMTFAPVKEMCFNEKLLI